MIKSPELLHAMYDATETPTFPPATWRDIDAYDAVAVVEGFTDGYRDWPDVQPPGENRSPAYRWGYQNALRDKHHEDDGFDVLRREYFRNGMASPLPHRGSLNSGRPA